MPDRELNEAAKPNPALARFGVLAGAWRTEGTHPLVPGKTFHGRTTFEWIEGGAFMIMRSRIEEPEIPSGIAIFGSDDSTGDCWMSYFDERGVSRRYEMRMHDDVLEYWRTTGRFSQRCVITIAPGGRRMVSRGTMSREGGAWEPDLELTYTRST
jgi:hypothetical protein